jgi:hypothetical protein
MPSRRITPSQVHVLGLIENQSTVVEGLGSRGDMTGFRVTGRYDEDVQASVLPECGHWIECTGVNPPLSLSASPIATP